MADLPVGATFGSLVHAVLEHADPDAADFRAELLGHIDEQLVRWPVDVDADELADCAGAVCDSPLGPLAGGATLRGHRAGRPAPGDGLRAAAGRRRRARLPGGAGHPRRRRAAAARAPARGGPAAALRRRCSSAPALGGQDLRGYLTGSVDVVLRVPDGSVQPLPGRRLQDQLARRLPRRGRTAAERRTTTDPRRSRRRWGTPTTRCRRCCTPWCCTGSCAGASPATTRRCTSAGCSTSTCAACAGRTPRWWTASPAGCSRGGRRWRWSRRSPTCWTGPAA